MAKQPFTMKDNFDEIVKKIQNNPDYAKAEIGRRLVQEIRPKVNRKVFKRGHQFMRATLQSWARRKEGDIIIGFKDPTKISFLKHIDWLDEMEWHYDQVIDPIKPTVIANLPMIKQLIAESLIAKEVKDRYIVAVGGEDTQP